MKLSPTRWSYLNKPISWETNQHQSQNREGGVTSRNTNIVQMHMLRLEGLTTNIIKNTGHIDWRSDTMVIKSTRFRTLYKSSKTPRNKDTQIGTTEAQDSPRDSQKSKFVDGAPCKDKDLKCTYEKCAGIGRNPLEDNSP